MSEIAERFGRVAADFTAVVDAVGDEAWSNPSPCEGWTARDIVGHLVEWIPAPGFLLGTFGIDTSPAPSVADDPAAAWAVVRDAIQSGLEQLSQYSDADLLDLHGFGPLSHSDRFGVSLVYGSHQH